jgi:glucose/arabinose dehydrogenase
MAWLPDGSMLVTTKSGILYHLKTAQNRSENVPVYIRGQGGLLDIVLHPDYAKMVGFTSPMLPRKAEEGGNTKLIRAKRNESLVQIESLYK